MSIQVAILPMTDTPTKTGRYPVLHRGSVAGDAFYWHPDDTTQIFISSPSAKIRAGWQGLPHFGPTHWVDTSELGEHIPMVTDCKRFWADKNGFPADAPLRPEIKTTVKKSLFKRIFSW
jgi:hypothetical protein